MELTLRLPIKRGLPPDEEPGQFIGFDGEGNAYILQWTYERQCWGGVGHDPEFEGKAFLFMTSAATDSFIVRYAPTPLTRAVDEALRKQRGNRKTLRRIEAAAR